VNELNLKNLSKRYKLYIPFIAISILSLYIFMHFTTRVQPFSGLSRFFHFLMDIEIFTVFYLKNLIYPYGLNPMYNIKGLYLSFLILSICVFLLIIFSLIITWKRAKDIFYFIIWLIIALVPYTHFILPVTYVAADRYIYVASLSFCFFLSLIITGLYNFREKRIYKIISVSFFILITIWYMTLTVSQNRIWKNSMVLWTYVTELDPEYKDNGLSLHFMGNVYFKSSDMENAIKYYEKALSYDEKNGNLIFSLGIACMAKGDYNKAIDYLEKAKKIDPSNFSIYNNLALIYSKKKLYDKAAEEYKKSLEFNPEQPDVKENLNMLLKSEK
ncbi:MAG: tetratricopeptide repeat protein, partial [Candidatus Eremiobacterota bacterium]